jgi:membrane protein implicated in regulation of membrane protease activity
VDLSSRDHVGSFERWQARHPILTFLILMAFFCAFYLTVSALSAVGWIGGHATWGLTLLFFAATAALSVLAIRKTVRRSRDLA